MSDHTCYCYNCHPDVFYSGPKLGDNHYGIRFVVGNDYESVNYDVFCDGVQISHCYECLVGEDGWAVCYCGYGGEHNNEHVHACQSCYVHACSRMVYGNVTVVKKQRQEVVL